MGSTPSAEEAEMIVVKMYENAKRYPDTFRLPDIGLDKSLLDYSGVNSYSVLQSYSDDLVNSAPGYIDRLGSSLASFSSVPNAVGLGALVLSMIMEICIKSNSQSNDNSYSMFQRVFGEEKASSVRDSMLEYVKRHRIYMNNKQQLQEELKRLEEKLSGHLTTLRNSLLHDGQMSSRGFNIWVNGASFHVQMLIHQARLNHRIGPVSLQDVNSISSAIDVYVQDLNSLLQKYKTSFHCVPGRHYPACCTEANGCSFRGEDIMERYINYIFSNHEPITGLEPHFLNFKNNLNSLISQHSAFTLPRA